MKILILTNYANGLYLFRKELLLKFLKEGHEVAVAVPQDENCRKIGKLGCRMEYVRLERRGSNPVHDLKLFLSYRRLLKKEKPDLVLTYTIKPNIYGGLACRLYKIPYVMNITGLGTAIENKGLLSRVLLILYRWAAGKAQRVFFQNERNRIFMQGHGVAKDNSALLPGSGVNLAEHPFREYPSEENGICFLAVIRIMKDKGIMEFLNAAEKIRTRLPEKSVQFVLAGEYEEETRDQYEPLIHKLCESGIITYLGHIDYVEKVMSKSHVIIHPSYHEGLSNVLLEAAACGRPVLATNVNGCKETFIEGKTGFSFDKEDTDALVKAVEKILSLTEAERKEMGKEARNFVAAHFDRQLVLAAYEKELERVRVK